MNYFKNKIFLTIFIISTLFLSGCLNDTRYKSAPIAKIAPKKVRVKKVYYVKSGDTLYSVASKLRVNRKELIRRNYLHKPYHLKIGQKINYVVDVRKTNKKYRPATKNLKNKRVARKSNIRKNYRKSELPKKVHASRKKIASKIKWKWPVKGKVLNNFYTKGTKLKGLDIISYNGAPVYAAASGKVVYSGNALRGYGNLIIIKHNNKFISAYAHNKELLVKEGTKVKVGQQIAKMGNTESKRTMLHFEVRYNGKPIDPYKVLPN